VITLPPGWVSGWGKRLNGVEGLGAPFRLPVVPSVDVGDEKGNAMQGPISFRLLFLASALFVRVPIYGLYEKVSGRECIGK
jgi:hypothetical protein